MVGQVVNDYVGCPSRLPAGPLLILIALFGGGALAITMRTVWDLSAPIQIGDAADRRRRIAAWLMFASLACIVGALGVLASFTASAPAYLVPILQCAAAASGGALLLRGLFRLTVKVHLIYEHGPNWSALQGSFAARTRDTRYDDRTELDALDLSADAWSVRDRANRIGLELVFGVALLGWAVWIFGWGGDCGAA